MSTAIWGGMGPGGLLTHRLDRNDDPQPGISAVIVAALFQGPDHFACFRERLVAITARDAGAPLAKYRDPRPS
jgi:hypothetical protein